jgi:hypothetical protein
MPCGLMQPPGSVLCYVLLEGHPPSVYTMGTLQQPCLLWFVWLSNWRECTFMYHHYAFQMHQLGFLSTQEAVWARGTWSEGFVYPRSVLRGGGR